MYHPTDNTDDDLIQQLIESVVDHLMSTDWQGHPLPEMGTDLTNGCLYLRASMSYVEVYNRFEGCTEEGGTRFYPFRPPPRWNGSGVEWLASNVDYDFEHGKKITVAEYKRREELDNRGEAWW